MDVQSLLDDLASDGFGYWLAGFIDGEGSFVIACSKRARSSFTCRLKIELRCDDAPILDEVQRRTGVGTTGKRGWRARNDGSRGVYNCRPQYHWTVSAKDDVAVLVAILDRFPLRAKKLRDYEIWREAALLWQEIPYVRGQTLGDWSPFPDLQQRLKDGRDQALTEALAGDSSASNR